MNSLIGISVRGKTYFFLNTLTHQELQQIKEYSLIFRKTYPSFATDDDFMVIGHFISNVQSILHFHLYPVNVDDIFTLK